MGYVLMPTTNRKAGEASRWRTLRVRSCASCRKDHGATPQGLALGNGWAMGTVTWWQGLVPWLDAMGGLLASGQ